MWRCCYATTVVAVSVAWWWWRRRRRRAPLCFGFWGRASRRGERFAAEVLLRNAMVPLEGQLGGLAHADHSGFMAVPEAHVVLKPLQSGSRGAREVSFYEYSIGRSISEFTPGYRGICGERIILDDVARGMDRPCTLDVKIGTRTYEDEAPLAKRLKERAKYPPQQTIGCRVVGMRVYRASHPTVYDRAWGYSLLERDDFEAGLAIFFNPNAPLQAFETRLERLLAWFRAPNDLVFIGSSLLFVYDAAHPDRVDLRLIDFAHVRRDSRTDHGAIVGLETLLSLIRRLRQRISTTNNNNNNGTKHHSPLSASSVS
ncbi:hypothetical protein CTAYLR_010655 [Chrysophaeum taylorii]|uniref:Kinase n=1 Tax=Chrysophaeum taylorii TaxID=2483200 RepID=A0AAD7UH21_9STRA|nr:hypothetical protein CTAYLR_010655 [Chrysophaeum taylorii]